MHLLVSILALIVPALAFAQITLGESDMPSAGDTMRYRIRLDMDINVDLTGPGTTWDYSTLVSMDEGADVAVPVSSTPLLYQFYFNNQFLYPDHHANFAMEGEEFDLQGFSLTEVYEYFKKGPTGYRNVGFGAMINGIPASVRRIPIDRIYQFPMTFGTVDSSFSSWEFDIPGTFYFSQDQWRHNTVDGWGTLQLPGGTFDVLRVRSVLNRHDSIFVSQFGTGFGFDEPETIEYKWLASGFDRPVLTVITVAGIPTSIEYIHEQEIETGVIDRNAIVDLQLHPNPADHELRITIPEGISGNAVIRDAQGKIVLEAGIVLSGTTRIAIQDLANGNYSIEIHGKDLIQRSQFIIQR